LTWTGWRGVIFPGRGGNNHPRISRDCPYCHATNSLLLIGTSAANLTSTWSASLYASAFNGDKRVLAFSDSVQDAAHRAGFIAGRAYRTSFRTALTRTVQEHDRQGAPPLRLDQLQERLIRDWQRRLPNPVDFAATFIPHDLEWLRDWDEMQKQLIPSLEPNSLLLRYVTDRLRWEVAAEFGYRARLGSSVEQAGALAAAVGSGRRQPPAAAPSQPSEERNRAPQGPAAWASAATRGWPVATLAPTWRRGAA
jgi:DEAD/DEAH box helicase domain-containing protein